MMDSNRHIQVKSFIETKLTLMKLIYLRIVSIQSAGKFKWFIQQQDLYPSPLTNFNFLLFYSIEFFLLIANKSTILNRNSLLKSYKLSMFNARSKLHRIFCMNIATLSWFFLQITYKTRLYRNKSNSKLSKLEFIFRKFCIKFID